MHKSTISIIVLVVIITLGGAFSVHNKRQNTAEQTTNTLEQQEPPLQANITNAINNTTITDKNSNHTNTNTPKEVNSLSESTTLTEESNTNSGQTILDLIKNKKQALLIAKQDQNLVRIASLYEEIAFLDKTTKVSFFTEYFIIQINQLKNYSQTIRTAQLLITNNPQSALAYNFLGWSYLQTNETHELAKENLLKAKKLDTEQQLPEIHLNLGDYYFQAEDFVSAKNYYLAAIQIESNA